MELEPRLKSIKIKFFKGIKKLSFNNIKKVNIITGRNNVGKTTLLESLNLIFSKDPLKYKYFLEKKFFLSSFYKYNKKNAPKIEIEYKKNKKRILEINPLRTYKKHVDLYNLINSTSSYFSNCKINTKKNDIKGSMLKIYDSYSSKIYNGVDMYLDNNNIEMFEYINRNVQDLCVNVNDNILYKFNKDFKELVSDLKKYIYSLVDIKYIDNVLCVKTKGINKYIPFECLGEGVCNMINILSTMYFSKENNYKFITIDNIERGLHYGNMDLMWKSFLEYTVKYDVTSFITIQSGKMLASLILFLLKKENHKYQEIFSLTCLFTIHKNKYTYANDITKTILTDKENLKELQYCYPSNFFGLFPYPFNKVDSNF